MAAKVRFRGGWTCSCVAESLPLVEEEMLLRGLIRSNIDIYQLGWRNDVGASAGTHSRGGCTDVGQYSDAQIDIWRLWGWTMQHRYPPSFMHHAHGWPWGCPHLAPAAQSQATQWRNRQNGLVSRGRVQGRWPIDTWTTAMTKRKKVLVALKDDIINGVVAKLRGDDALADHIADAILTRDGKIPNTLTDNPGNKYVSLAGALEALGKRTDYLVNRSITKDGMVKNEYNPADPNNTIAVTTALTLLLRRQREQGGDADLAAKLDAILAAVTPAPAPTSRSRAAQGEPK